MLLDAQWRTDVKDNNAVRHVQICPLYAMSQMDKLLSAFLWKNNQ